MKVQFSASLDYLHEMLAFVKQQAKEAGFAESVIASIELAVEEALVNIIKHGYGGKEGKILLDCSSLEGRGLKVELIDQGVSCNPLENKKDMTNLPLESRPVGGYGVFLILQLVDQADYRREGNSNILTLVKFLPKS